MHMSLVLLDNNAFKKCRHFFNMDH